MLGMVKHNQEEEYTQVKQVDSQEQVDNLVMDIHQQEEEDNQELVDMDNQQEEVNILVVMDKDFIHMQEEVEDTIQEYNHMVEVEVVDTLILIIYIK